MLKWSEISASEKARDAIKHGEHPVLTWPGSETCPVAPGDEVVIQTIQSLAGPIPHLSIRIIAVHRTKSGDHLAEYAIRDDRPLYLDRGHGYTRSVERTIDAEAPVIDAETASQQSAEARLKRSKRPDDPRKRERRVRDRLRAVLSGLDDPSALALLADIERAVQRAEAAE